MSRALHRRRFAMHLPMRVHPRSSAAQPLFDLPTFNTWTSFLSASSVLHPQSPLCSAFSGHHPPISAYCALCPSFVFITLRIAFPASPLFSEPSELPYVFPNHAVRATASSHALPYFQQLTNPSLSTIKYVDKHPLYPQELTNPFPPNSFVFSSIQNARVSPPPIFHWQPLAGRDRAFPFRHFSANY